MFPLLLSSLKNQHHYISSTFQASIIGSRDLFTIHVDERLGLQRDEHCLDCNGAPKKGGQMSTSVNTELIVSNYSSCCRSLEIWLEKNKISPLQISRFSCTAFFRLISICSLPSSQILCLGRINQQPCVFLCYAIIKIKIHIGFHKSFRWRNQSTGWRSHARED